VPEPPQPSLSADDAHTIKAFLSALVDNSGLLAEYILNPGHFLFESADSQVQDLRKDLSEEAKGLLVYGDFPRVQVVMRQASDPVRWIVIWIV
jgi:hypothetical protein